MSEEIKSVLIYSALIVFILILAYHLHDLVMAGEGFATSRLKNITQEYRNIDREKSGQGHANMLTSDSNRPPYAGKENLSLNSANNLLTGEHHYKNAADAILENMYNDNKDGNEHKNYTYDVEAEAMASNQLHEKMQQDTYNDYLIDSQLDQGTLVSHQQFVYDQNKLRNKGGTASHHSIFTPSFLPFTGLPRFSYRDADSGQARAGTENSVDSSQLPQAGRKIII